MFKIIKTGIAVSILLIACFMILLNICKTVPTISQDECIELPILMYHSILKDTDMSGKYVVTPKQLSDDIEYVYKKGYTSISANELIDFVDNGTPLPEKPIMLTFDDGCYNNYEYVLPILENYNAHGIFCIVGKYTDDFTDTNEANANYGYMRWIDVVNLSVNSHAEISNHSYDFHKYSNGRTGSKKIPYENIFSYKKIFKEDTEKLQNACILHMNFAPVIYTYPFGAYSQESTDVLKELGIRMSLTCNEGINLISHNPDCLFLLKRNNRPNNVETAEFFKGIINE